MDIDIFKSLKVQDDELRIVTKSKFCINQIKKLADNIYVSSNIKGILNNEDSIDKSNNDGELESISCFDKKYLGMKNRLTYLLSPEDNQFLLEGYKNEDRKKNVKKFF